MGLSGACQGQLTMCATQEQRCYPLTLKFNSTSQIFWLTENKKQMNWCFGWLTLSRSIISKCWSVVFSPMVQTLLCFFPIFLPFSGNHDMNYFTHYLLHIGTHEKWDLNDLLGSTTKCHACPRWWGMSVKCALKWLLLLISLWGWAPSAIRQSSFPPN